MRAFKIGAVGLERSMFDFGVRAEAVEIGAVVPGDELVVDADVVMDRGFTLPVPPTSAWPWFAQLGKNRAGWYLPRWVEAVLPVRRRALRRIDPALQVLVPGDVIDDWGGAGATFEVVRHEAPGVIVYWSVRGRVRFSWVILLTARAGQATRVHLRLRIGGVRRRWLVEYGGGLFDLLTVAGLAAGLRERVT
ncbi:hypothetical protein [Actinokineospora sp. NBRC 105648]|uniref:hypothetical protein n=1 Tax=Actinokineospora sp. NBRC 105648 TaxID=3032206 RepID=UPI0024A1E2E6|nr:hypothetical protein [Actinokineospora sp. NBRC 105648]GLZ38405.1 hypothetical protein Acsp05_20290 [Actinokineospora sp. NBRC 105648]